ncbi:MAG: carboxypeptidase-like regulatory domain-containing protein [Cellvibrionaceae bacterium]
MSVRVVKIVLLAVAVNLLNACIPAVVEVYEAPLIYGQILDKDGVQPIVGARVQHQHLDSAPVYTDEQGYFELPSISSYQAVVLMPAHGLKGYHYTVTVGEQTFPFQAQATILMRSEEAVYAPILFEGNTVREEFSQLLPEGIYDDGMRAIRESIIYSNCDTQVLRVAFLQVAQQHSRPEEERDSAVYRQARKAWESCSKALEYAPLSRPDQWAIDEFTRLLARWQWR